MTRIHSVHTLFPADDQGRKAGEMHRAAGR